MSKINTRAKTYVVMRDYRLADGSKAQWMCQLPKTWKEHVADRVQKYCEEQRICSDDIPVIVQNVLDDTIGSVLLDVFYPYREEYADYAHSKRGANR